MGRIALLLCVIAACGTSDDPEPGPDPGKVTVTRAKPGVVMSVPSGLYCGTCVPGPPVECPTPPPPQVCDYDFGIGFEVMLRLGLQQIYVSACSSPDDPTITTCTFVVTKSVNVTVDGFIAVD